jgi:hypothetical protein
MQPPVRIWAKAGCPAPQPHQTCRPICPLNGLVEDWWRPRNRVMTNSGPQTSRISAPPTGEIQHLDATH